MSFSRSAHSHTSTTDFKRSVSASFFRPQAKLNIGQANDKYEKEADAVADKVVNKGAISGSSEPFFTPQAKLNSGNSNDKYEKEADSVADKVAHKGDFFGNTEPFFKPLPKIQLSRGSVSEVQTSKEEDIQSKDREALGEQEGSIQMKKETDIQWREVGVKSSPEAPVVSKTVTTEKPIRDTISRLVQRSPSEDVQTKCNKCQGDDLVQRMSASNCQLDSSHVQTKCAACDYAESIQKMGGGLATASGASSLESSLSNSQGKGSRMDSKTGAEMESAFGADFSGVRIHSGAEAIQMNQDLGARAFANGNDIYFNSGEYKPDSKEGKHLLAHELTHTIQQGNNTSNIQRTTHGGTTPCNCHDWRIGLPPWIAGTFAHGQIASFALARGIHPQAIPRATKTTMGTPTPPSGTNWGFADLWLNNASNVQIAEIKSTATGDGPARAEAAHYGTRHNEWNTRLGTGTATDSQDSIYGSMVGGPKPSSMLDLSPYTGTGIPLGPFVADPFKLLWTEGDNMGSVVYWCTDLLDPVLMALWALVLAAVREMMNAAKRVMETALELAYAAYEWLAANWEYVVLAILLVVAIILCIIFAEAIAAFLAALALAVVAAIEAAAAALAGAGAALAAAAVLFALIGLDSAPMLTAGNNLTAGLTQIKPQQNAASGADYERNTGSGASAGAAPPNSRPDIQGLLGSFGSSVAFMANPISIFESAKSAPGRVNADMVARISSGIDIIDSSGAGSGSMRSRLTSVTAGKV